MKVKKFMVTTENDTTVFQAHVGKLPMYISCNKVGSWKAFITDYHGKKSEILGQEKGLLNPIQYRQRNIKPWFSHSKFYKQFKKRLRKLTNRIEQYYQDEIKESLTLQLAEQIKAYGILPVMFRLRQDLKTRQTLCFDVEIDGQWHKLPNDAFYPDMCKVLPNRHYNDYPNSVTLIW